MALQSDEISPIKLYALEEEERALGKTIAHLYSLLDKADKRKKGSPKDSRRWNRTIDQLETSLIETKSHLQGCQQDLKEMRRHLGVTESEIDRPEAAPTELEAVEAPGVTEDELELAAEHVMSTPMNEVQELPLQEVAMAKAYLETKGAATSKGEKREALSKRIEEYSGMSLATTGTAVDKSERRHQHMLRNALEKAVGNEIDSLTIMEIEMIAGCVELTRKRAAAGGENSRLDAVLTKAVENIHSKCSHLNQVYERIKNA